MSGYQENRFSRGRVSRGGYAGKNWNPNHHSNSHRDDCPERSVSFNIDERAGAARAYNSAYNSRDRYNDRDNRGGERAPYDSRDRTSGFNSPADSRGPPGRPDLLDMSRMRDNSRSGSPITSAGGFASPTSVRPGSNSGEKLVDEIRKMMRTVSHNYMLERERDAAKRNYESTLKIYRETQAMKEAYPQSEYLARHDRDEAQATFDRLDHELREAERKFDPRNIARNIEELVPAAAASKPSVALQEELAQNKRQMESMNSQISNLVAKLNDTEKETRKLEAEVKRVDTTARSASGQASRQSTRVDEVTQRYGKVPEIEKKLIDLVATVEKRTPTGAADRADAAQADLLKKRVVGLESQMSNVMQTQKGLDNKFATIATYGPGRSGAASPSISNTEVKELTTRVVKLEEANKSQDAHLKRVDGTLATTDTSLTELVNHRQRVDEDLKQLNENMKTFDDDITYLSQQVDLLKSAGGESPPEPQSKSTNPDAMDVNTALTATPRRTPRPLNEKAEAARKELKVSPAVYEALGEIPAMLVGLQNMKEYLAEAQGEALDQLAAEIDKLRDDVTPKIDYLGQLAANFDKLRDDITPRIDSLDKLAAKVDEIMPRLNSISDREKDLKSRMAKLQKDHDSLLMQTKALAALPQPAAPAPAPAFNAQKECTPNNVQADMSFAALEELSRKLSEVDTKIDGVDTKYGILHRGLDTRMQNTHTDALALQILGQLQNAYPNLANTDESIRAINRRGEELTRQMQELKKTSDKIRDVVNAQGFEVQQGKKGRLEFEAFKEQMSERVEELAKVVESIDRKVPGGEGGGGADQRIVDELRKKVDWLMAGTINGGHRVVTQAQLDPIKLDITRTAEDSRKAIERVKLDVNDKLRAFDIQLQEFREKITFDGDESVKEKMQMITEYAQGLEADIGRFREKYESSVLGKRTASQATSPSESDAAVNGEKRKRKKKKRYGAFVEDSDGEDPFERGGEERV